MFIFNVEDKGTEFKITIEKFHIQIPKNLLYSTDDLWVKPQDSGVLLGITDFFQLVLGDIMFVEIRKSSGAIKKGAEIGSIESLKTVLDLISPISGKILETNPAIVEKTEILNKDPYFNGWVCKIQPSNFKVEREALMTAEAYVQLVRKKSEEEKKRKAQQRKS